MIHQLDRPPLDTSGRDADGAGATTPSHRPKPITNRDPAARCAADEVPDASDARPMIKPSSHQKVAIKVHRQDWP
jgi:hypothetical protein